MTDARSLIPVIVLTGFLGSGKTTVLNHLLRDPQMEGTAVIINEFGDIGIDDVLIQRSSSDTVLLSSGCICCTMKDDLTSTLQELIFQVLRGDLPQFRRVVIETTGLADPGPILQTLMQDPMLTAHYRLGGVIVTVDAVNGARTLTEHSEAVHQVAVADRLLLTKVDLADNARVARLTTRLADLNPSAELLTVTGGAVDARSFLNIGLINLQTKMIDVRNWLKIEAFAARDGHRHDHSEPHDHNDHGIQSYVVIRAEPLPWAVFGLWIDALTLRGGPDILRIKGIVNIRERPGSPVVVHGVQDIFHPPVSLDAWPTNDHRTRIVFITRNIGQQLLEYTLSIFEAQDGDA